PDWPCYGIWPGKREIRPLEWLFTLCWAGALVLALVIFYKSWEIHGKFLLTCGTLWNIVSVFVAVLEWPMECSVPSGPKKFQGQQSGKTGPPHSLWCFLFP